MGTILTNSLSSLHNSLNNKVPTVPILTPPMGAEVTTIMVLILARIRRVLHPKLSLLEVLLSSLVHLLDFMMEAALAPPPNL